MFQNTFRNIFNNKNNYYNLILIIFIAVILFFFSTRNSDDNNLNINNSDDAFNSDKNDYDNYKGFDDNKNNIYSSSYDASYEQSLEARLKLTLSKVEGVGDVEVMISTENGKEIVTKSDITKENSITSENALTGDARNIQSGKYQDSTVKINGDEPLILKEISPKIEGVLIVAQGGDNIEIKNSLINATNALLGVEIHKIQVLKMR
ncbi:MAG: hypothetical protein R3Y29_07755 [bacterium]